MMSLRPPFLAVALGCGLFLLPSAGLRAQSASPTPIAQPGDEQDPLKRERSDKEKFAARKAVCPRKNPRHIGMDRMSVLELIDQFRQRGHRIVQHRDDLR